ncbi:MAG: MarR family transcriptional regulator, organic hydroperoxide resistance regulator [Acidobacteriota bacterium]|jgi:DNA-binding MarR family transcriptional regulator|nr:MarR family transcriptional regulator, organic hydroperoxide resistance regulator [Acidobacteriota bacterium]
MAGKLMREIRQKKPFRTLHEEIALSLVRAADHTSASVLEVLKAAALSSSQYNVLRILRGSAPDGLPCGEISERMVRRDPDLTRLLDRLDARGLVVRTRDTRDRRIVRAAITDAGLKLLAELDAPVEENIKASLAHMPASRLRMLLELLEEVRAKEG